MTTEESSSSDAAPSTGRRGTAAAAPLYARFSRTSSPSLPLPTNSHDAPVSFLQIDPSTPPLHTALNFPSVAGTQVEASTTGEKLRGAVPSLSVIAGDDPRSLVDATTTSTSPTSPTSPATASSSSNRPCDALLPSPREPKSFSSLQGFVATTSRPPIFASSARNTGADANEAQSETSRTGRSNFLSSFRSSLRLTHPTSTSTSTSTSAKPPISSTSIPPAPLQSKKLHRKSLSLAPTPSLPTIPTTTAPRPPLQTPLSAEGSYSTALDVMTTANELVHLSQTIEGFGLGRPDGILTGVVGADDDGSGRDIGQGRKGTVGVDDGIGGGGSGGRKGLLKGEQEREGMMSSSSSIPPTKSAKALDVLLGIPTSSEKAISTLTGECFD